MDTKAAITKLWEMGDLTYKLKGIQREMRNAVYESKGKNTVFLCARRTGKSFTMCTIAVEYCIRKPNQVVKLIFPKKKDARSVAKSHMVDILADCPPHIKPEFKTQDNEYLFPNGSMIQMAGTDGGSAESVRGSAAHLILLDEAGFHDYSEFTYIVRSILMPTLLTTKGKMIMASTPSKQPDHPFMVEYVAQARAEQTLIEYDIYCNPLITEDDIEEIIDEYPGREEDPAFKREFLLISEADTDAMVIPEFTKSVKSDIVKENPMPAYYDCYVSGDPAVGDLTGILFAYYDFMRDKVVILDELVMGGAGEKQLTTQDIADGVFRKERSLFKNPLTGEKNEPLKRIMDNNNPILINDLNKEHGLKFIATRKDNKEDQINKVRMMIRRGDIEINPRCKNLVYHIETARWKIRKSDGKRVGYERVAGTSDRKFKGHHADLVDALIYLVRNINTKKNPFPDGFDFYGHSEYHIPKDQMNKGIKSFFQGIMGKSNKNDT